MMKRKLLWLGVSSVVASIGLGTLPAIAAEQIEEVVVTGSYIKGTPEDAALPVDVLTRQDLEDVGDPTIIEMVRNLGITSGNAGETNQFASVGQEAGSGVALVNLRGLGASRTLVLINGRRQVSSGTLGVDINAVPSSTIGRVEVLKDGAAALYGSDAIGGVVNFITRDDFVGLEVRGAYQDIQDAGDQEASFMYGYDGGAWHFTLAGEYEHRDELGVKDRSWALPTFAQNSQGGFSSIGNPGTFFPAIGTGTIISGGVPDPNCNALGGVNAAGFCRFQYTYFDNLIEETESSKLFATFNYTISDNAELHVEALWSQVDTDEWKTSPSYPPQSLLGKDRFIAANHPGLVDLKAQNPGLFKDIDLTAAGIGVIPAAAQGATSWSRMAGVGGIRGGGSEEGPRETETVRFAVALNGVAFDELNYDFAMSYSNRERFSGTNDMYVERMAFAFDGLGGAGCDQATGTPGVGGCEYYNPFSNAIPRSAVTGQANPQYNPAVGNSDALLDWLTDRLDADTRHELLVFDAIFSGETGISLGGGNVSWAAGAQSRRERYELELNDVTNLAINPCPYRNPASVTRGNTTKLDCTGASTGLFAFLSGTTEERTKRTVYGVFGELALPFTDTFDMQAAIRYEDYGGNVGSTIDPKLAARWQANDWFAVRGSASTTFRGPPQSILSGVGTALAFVTAPLAFKAIDTLGNPNLKPEKAVALNLGFIVDTGAFYGSIDYWNFEFEDPIQVESFEAILGAYGAASCQNGGAGVGTPTCGALRQQVFPLGTTAAGVERIARNWINGATINTSGVDFFGEYTFDAMGGELAVGLEGTYTLEYESEDQTIGGGLVVVAPKQDYAGRLNDINSFTPLPELKGNVFAKFRRGDHNFTYAIRYIDSYRDEDPTAQAHLRTIDSHVTHDVHWNYEMSDKLRMSVSVINALDEDPPAAALDLNYDPLTHNAFGRMVKLGVVYTPILD